MKWTTTPLDQVASVFNGKTPAKNEQRTEGHPVLKIRDVSELGTFRGPFESFVDSGLAEKHAHRMVCAGDTLILNAAHNPDYVASKTFRASPASFGALATGEWLIVRPDSQVLDPGFANHWINTRHTRLQLRELVNGIHLYPKDVARLKIPLPPLPEQRRIAAILDQADTLRTQRRAALAQLDSLTQSLFLAMFGDPVTNPKGWPKPLFGSVGRLDRGVSKHRPRNAPELIGGPYPLVQTGEVANCDGYIRAHNSTYSEVGLRQSKMWPKGTLCITIAANIAKTGILTFDACFPDSVVGFRADDPATVEYIRVWLSFLQKALEESAPESAQKNINLAILRDLPLPLPPLARQQSFATRVQAIEALKAQHRAALAEADALFAALQQRAFAGSL